MISYKLAKELKDAGFPQLYEQGDYIEDPNAPEDDIDGAYSPSLEELIDACGDEFETLSPVKFEDKIHMWCVQGRGLKYTETSREEAVARLYLALKSNAEATKSPQT